MTLYEMKRLKRLIGVEKIREQNKMKEALRETGQA
jgi:hypothetical protein